MPVHTQLNNSSKRRGWGEGAEPMVQTCRVPRQPHNRGLPQESSKRHQAPDLSGPQIKALITAVSGDLKLNNTWAETGGIQKFEIPELSCLHRGSDHSCFIYTPASNKHFYPTDSWEVASPHPPQHPHPHPHPTRKCWCYCTFCPTSHCFGRHSQSLTGRKFAFPLARPLSIVSHKSPGRIGLGETNCTLKKETSLRSSTEGTKRDKGCERDSGGWETSQ